MDLCRDFFRRIDKQEVFVRWRARTGSGLGPFSDLTYSLHYAHLFDDIPIYELGNRINAGFAYQIAGPRAIGGGIDFSRHRYDLAGFSFDKALMWLPGALEGTVMRGEVVYNMGKRFYEPDLETHKADQVTALIGLDQYLYVGPRDITPTACSVAGSTTSSVLVWMGSTHWPSMKKSLQSYMECPF